MNTNPIVSDENNDYPENESQNLNKKTKKKGGSQKTSWVWAWFESVETGSICKVEVVKGQFCNKHYQNGSSTGNLIGHLVDKHKITKDVKKHDYVVRNFNLI